MNSTKQILVSAVCYVDGTEPSPMNEARLLRDSLATQYAYVEIVLVCGSHGGAWESCVEIAKVMPDVRAYMISGKTGENAALTWGLEMAIGDMVVTCRLSPGFHLGVVALAEASLAGSGLSCAARRAERGWLSGVSARATRLLTGVEYDPTLTPYWAFSRSMLNQVLSVPTIDRSLPIRVLSLGKPVSRVVIAAKLLPITIAARLVILMTVIIRASPVPARYLAAACLLSMLFAIIYSPESLARICALGVLTQLSLLAIVEARTMSNSPSPSVIAEAQSHSFLRDQAALNTIVG